jgi:putative ABC transport system permease protein
VVAQVALALVLLLGAGALARGFQRLATARTELVPDGVLTLRVNLPAARYPEDHHVIDAQRRMVERLAELPGVDAVAAALNIPWGTNGWTSVPAIEGRDEPPGRRPSVNHRPASPGYFELLRMPVLEGRTFTAADGADAPPVAVVSTAAVRRYWPDTTPIGKRLSFGGDRWLTVVGVVADVELFVGDPGPRPTVYVPLAQQPRRGFYFALRTRGGDPLAHARAAQAAIHSVDPLLPVFAVKTLAGARHERFAGIRIAGQLMASFALLALLLAVVGIYGVIANLVNQRTHEIGVRMALGARGGDVVRLVLRKGLVLTAIGLVIGLALGTAAVKTVASFMLGVFENELVLFVALPPAVAALALLGCWVPARRATRVDPMIALRSE